MHHPPIERRVGEGRNGGKERNRVREVGKGKGEGKFIEIMQMVTHKVFLLHKEDCLEKL